MKPRARRIALIVASVPLETRRTCSTGATRRTISSARATSFSEGVPKEKPLSTASAHRLEDRRVGVPEDHRAPAAHEVDVLAAVGVGEPRPATAPHEAGGAAHGAEGAHR